MRLEEADWVCRDFTDFRRMLAGRQTDVRAEAYFQPTPEGCNEPQGTGRVFNQSDERELGAGDSRGS